MGFPRALLHVIPANAGISSGEKRRRLLPALPSVIPAKAGIQTASSPGTESDWIPASAGMTCLRRLFRPEIPAFAGMTGRGGASASSPAAVQ